MRVGYVRVSTGEQEDALEQQTYRINKAGAVLIFSDIESGRSDNRKEFNKMLTMCREGQIKEVIVTRVDRLARSVITISKTIALFEELQVKLIILDAPVDDSSSPFGWFSLNQMAGLAEFESRLLQNRVKHGLAYFREQNKACPQPPFGYVRIDEKYEPDMTLHKSGKTNWAIAAEIVEYFLENKASLRKTVQYLSKKYNVKFSPPGLRGWFRNPVLRGHTRYGVRKSRIDSSKWDIREDTHTALMSKEVYEQIEAQLSDNKNLWGKNFEGGNNRNSISRYLLSGQIICGSCGYKCYVHDRKKTNGIRCKRRRIYGDAECDNKTAVPLKKVIEAVDSALTAKAIELKNYTINNQPSIEETPEIIELKTRLESLQRMPQDEIIEDAVRRTILKIQQIQQKNTHGVTVSNHLINQLKESFHDYEFFKTLPDEVKSQLYKKFVKHVKVLNGDIVEVALVDILG